ARLDAPTKRQSGEPMATHLDTGPAPKGAEPPASGLSAGAGETPARRPHFLRRFLLRPEAGGAISALVVFTFFAVLAGQNGFWTKLPSSIVPLAPMLMVTGGMLGISIALTGSTSISAIASGSAAVLFTSKWQEFHVSILYWLVLTAIATWVMQRTPFGNWVY